MVRLSVLLPVYNVEAYVAEALASIQSQTISDIEIVVVDDGSTDETLRIVERIASTDLRVKIFRTSHNLGLPAALNFGLLHCHAPYIARMDGDDVALPSRLEKQLRFLEENPEIGLVGCATTAIDENGQPISGLGISRRPLTQEQVDRTKLLAAPCLHIWMARAEVYQTLSGYREIPFVEDYDFLLRTISAGYRISNLPEPLMLIRTRRGGLSSRIQQRKAHHYVTRMFREREKSGCDSFGSEGYLRAIHSNRLETLAFHLSMKILQRGARIAVPWMRLPMIAIAALLSPWQARYLFDRVRFQIAMRS